MKRAPARFVGIAPGNAQLQALVSELVIIATPGGDIRALGMQLVNFPKGDPARGRSAVPEQEQKSARQTLRAARAVRARG